MNESGWLIESNFSFPTPRWLRVSTCGIDAQRQARIGWTDDASEAMRFGRRQDAEKFAYLHPQHCTLAKHEWL